MNFTTDFNCLTDFDLIILNILSKTKDLKSNRKSREYIERRIEDFIKNKEEKAGILIRLLDHLIHQTFKT